MPPSKSRVTQDDSRSEASSSKEKTASAGNNQSSKGRRVTGHPGPVSSLRDMTTVATVSSGPSSGTTGGPNQEINVGVSISHQALQVCSFLIITQMQWSTLDPAILHSYRHAYHLNTPSAFTNEYNHLILSRPGIGRLSPTMARHRDQRRQSKDQLANAVRKHFNGLGIQENEVVVDFLYKVRWQGL
jgi:histone deacetylase complex subunit SAP30